MNHISKIAEKLADYGLDAMLITSESGELYALASTARVCCSLPGRGATTPPTGAISRPPGSR